MSYPIYIGCEEAGALTETRDGLYRRFRAECAMREGLIRLWLHGEGRSVYLGVLTPQGGVLRLEKRFSRSAAASLPAVIDCARDCADVPASAAPVLPEAPPEKKDELIWVSRGKTLIAFDGRFHYTALPAVLSPASPAARRLRRIGGKDYLVFRR